MFGRIFSAVFNRPIPGDTPLLPFTGQQKPKKPRTFFGPAQLVADASSLGRSLPPFFKKEASARRRVKKSTQQQQQHSKEELRNIRLHTVPKFAELVVFQKRANTFTTGVSVAIMVFLLCPLEGAVKIHL